MPRHSAAAATPAAARPLQRGQNRVTAGPSPCASGTARATAPAPVTEGPALLTCISSRRHLRDVAAGSGRGRLAQAYWGTKSHNASLCHCQSDFSETLPPDKCILEVVILASGKVGCALRVGRQLTSFSMPFGRRPPMLRGFPGPTNEHVARAGPDSFPSGRRAGGEPVATAEEARSAASTPQARSC